MIVNKTVSDNHCHYELSLTVSCLNIYVTVCAQVHMYLKHLSSSLSMLSLPLTTTHIALTCVVLKPVGFNGSTCIVWIYNPINHFTLINIYWSLIYCQISNFAFKVFIFTSTFFQNKFSALKLLA